MSKACLVCGKPSDWEMRLDIKRKGDPYPWFRCCPRCSETGPWKRRNRSMRLDEDYWAAWRARQEVGGE